MQGEALRLGVLGAARIALGGIVPAAARTEAVDVVAVATRGGKKASEVREAAPGAALFEDYDALLKEADVEAIYIPLPNSLHVEWTLKALEAGKHVLCEKPFSQDAEGAERAVEATRTAGLALMEGFMYRFHPQMTQLAGLLREGAVGEVRQVIAEFGHRIDEPEDVRMDGSLGGGSLGDVGCYCVSGLRLAFGSEPIRASAFGRFIEDEADEELTGILEFEGGLGFVSCGASSARRERLEVVGTDGRHPGYPVPAGQSGRGDGGQARRRSDHRELRGERPLPPGARRVRPGGPGGKRPGGRPGGDTGQRPRR